MKHLFIPFEIAKQLKDKGFNEPCFRCYDNEGYLTTQHDSHIAVYGKHYNDDKREIYSAPIFQQAIDWFREKHNLHITLKHHTTSQTYGFVISGKYKGLIDPEIVNETFSKHTYYEALNQAITEVLKLI